MVDICDTLLEAIDKVAEMKIKENKFDITKVCVISDASEASVGKYKVTNEHIQYTAFSDHVDYKVGDEVNVLVPQGNYDNSLQILGKHVSETKEATSIEAINRFNDFVNVENIYTGAEEIGLIANGRDLVSPTQEAYWAGTKTQLKNFPTLGVSLQMSTVLENGTFKVTEGNYGLNLFVLEFINANQDDLPGSPFITFGTEEKVSKMLIYLLENKAPEDLSGEDPSFKNIYANYYNSCVVHSFSFDSRNMTGAIYNFNNSLQNQIFNIKDCGNIVGVFYHLYQRNNFKTNILESGEDGSAEYSRLATASSSNIIGKSINISLGYDAVDLNGDFIEIYTFDSLQYDIDSKRLDASRQENIKDILLRWIHLQEDGSYKCFTSIDDVDRLYPDAKLQWYRYVLGQQSNTDKYGGLYWEPCGEENNFSLEFIPDYIPADDKVKAVLVLPRIVEETSEMEQQILTSNLITFINNAAKPKDSNVVNSLALICENIEDSAQGIYNYYGRDLHLENPGEKDITRFLKLYLPFSDNYKNIKLTWYIPLQATMIASPIVKEKSSTQEYYKKENMSTQWLKAFGDMANTNTEFTSCEKEYYDNIECFKIVRTFSKINDKFPDNFFKCSYAIKDTFYSNNLNNTITCIVELDGVIYKAKKELIFGRTNAAGMGYSFNILFSENSPKYVTYYTESGMSTEITVEASLYYNQTKIDLQSSTNSNGYAVNWGWGYADGKTSLEEEERNIPLSNQNTNNYMQTIKINNLFKERIGFNSDSLLDWNVFPLKARVTINEIDLYAYLSIPIRLDEDIIGIEAPVTTIYSSYGDPISANDQILKCQAINGSRTIENTTHIETTVDLGDSKESLPTSKTIQRLQTYTDSNERIWVACKTTTTITRSNMQNSQILINGGNYYGLIFPQDGGLKGAATSQCFICLTKSDFNPLTYSDQVAKWKEILNNKLNNTEIKFKGSGQSNTVESSKTITEFKFTSNKIRTTNVPTNTWVYCETDSSISRSNIKESKIKFELPGGKTIAGTIKEGDNPSSFLDLSTRKVYIKLNTPSDWNDILKLFDMGIQPKFIGYSQNGKGYVENYKAIKSINISAFASQQNDFDDFLIKVSYPKGKYSYAANEINSASNTRIWTEYNNKEIDCDLVFTQGGVSPVLYFVRKDFEQKFSFNIGVFKTKKITEKTNIITIENRGGYWGLKSYCPNGRDGLKLAPYFACGSGQKIDDLLLKNNLHGNSYSEIKTSLDEQDYFDIGLRPPQVFDSYHNTYFAITVGFGEGDTWSQLWSQPLLYLQDVYGNAILNEWDGSLVIDEENNKIFSEIIGAGSKNNNNQFSGVFMGKVGVEGTGAIHGLYGYHNGSQAFGFREDGTAFLGESGDGRILLNGEDGEIRSGNWNWSNKGTRLKLKNGSLQLYQDENQSDPAIQVKSGNTEIFKVSKDAIFLQSKNYDGKIGTRIDLSNSKGSIYSSNFDLNAGVGFKTISISSKESTPIQIGTDVSLGWEGIISPRGTLGSINIDEYGLHSSFYSKGVEESESSSKYSPFSNPFFVFEKKVTRLTITGTLVRDQSKGIEENVTEKYDIFFQTDIGDANDTYYRFKAVWVGGTGGTDFMNGVLPEANGRSVDKKTIFGTIYKPKPKGDPWYVSYPHIAVTAIFKNNCSNSKNVTVERTLVNRVTIIPNLKDEELSKKLKYTPTLYMGSLAVDDIYKTSFEVSPGSNLKISQRLSVDYAFIDLSEEEAALIVINSIAGINDYTSNLFLSTGSPNLNVVYPISFSTNYYQKDLKTKKNLNKQGFFKVDYLGQTYISNAIITGGTCNAKIKLGADDYKDAVIIFQPKE